MKKTKWICSLKMTVRTMFANRYELGVPRGVTWGRLETPFEHCRSDCWAFRCAPATWRPHTATLPTQESLRLHNTRGDFWFNLLLFPHNDFVQFSWSEQSSKRRLLFLKCLLQLHYNYENGKGSKPAYPSTAAGQVHLLVVLTDLVSHSRNGASFSIDKAVQAMSPDHIIAIFLI